LKKNFKLMSMVAVMAVMTVMMMTMTVMMAMRWVGRWRTWRSGLRARATVGPRAPALLVYESHVTS